MKLLLLRCPRCNHSLTPSQDDQVVQCANCRAAVGISEERLSLLPALYAPATVEAPSHWLPFWVYKGQVNIIQRKTQGGRSAEREAREFWAEPRRVYIPGWNCDLLEARDLVKRLLEKQPPLNPINPTDTAAFEPVVVTPVDARKLLELVIVSMEAERSDYLQSLDFDLHLDSEALWLIPAERHKNEWQLLLKHL